MYKIYHAEYKKKSDYKTDELYIFIKFLTLCSKANHWSQLKKQNFGGFFLYKVVDF